MWNQTKNRKKKIVKIVRSVTIHFNAGLIQQITFDIAIMWFLLRNAN